MKWTFLTLLIFSHWALGRDERQLLKCLGAEEKRLHLAKDVGPLYDLNQRLINELLQIPHADISSQDYQSICQHPEISESLRLLQLSIQKGKDLFTIPAEVPKMQRQVATGMIDDYIEVTKEIFLNLITQIQVLAPTPHCLKEEIPQLNELFTDMKYLQEEIDIKKIFKGREEKIFKELKQYPQAFEKCRARLKKKPKSPSTSTPKKR